MNKQILFILILTFFVFSNSYSSNSATQKSNLDSVKVSLKVKDMQLRKAIQLLSAQTKIHVIFNDALVKDFKVDCSFKNKSLRKALEELLINTNLTFKTMKDGQIVILKKNKEKNFDLKGFIKDSFSGETLPYANVFINGTSMGTTSNMNGYFVLHDVPVERCTLTVHYIGYEDFELPIIAHSSRGFFEIELKQKVLPGNEVVVAAENFQLLEVTENPSHVRLSPVQMTSMPSIGEVDVFRFLQLIPGINSVNEGSTGLFVRGGTPDQNLILFDGITIYNVDHFFGFSSTINSDAVKDVQVFKGGFPARFGNRLSSVIELTGKTGSTNKFKVGTNFNLLSGSGIVQIPINNRGACLLSFRRSYTNYLKSDLYNDIMNAFYKSNSANNPADPENENSNQNPDSQTNRRTTNLTPDFYYYDVIGKFTYLITNNDVFSLSFYKGYDFLDQSQNISKETRNNVPARMINKIEDVTEWGNIGFSSNWSRIWNNHVYSNMTASFSRYFSYSSRNNKNKIDNPTDSFPNYAEQNEIRNLSFHMDNEWQLNNAHRIEFGIQHSKNIIDILFTTVDTIKNLNRNDEADQTTFYSQYNWKISNPMEVSIGLRATYYFPTMLTYLEPRASFNYSVSKNLSIKGAWGEYYQFINRITNDNALEGNRDFWLLANEQLEPSYAEHQIIGLTYESTDILLSVEAYYKNLLNIAEFSQRFRRPPGSDLGKLFQVGTGTSNGVEFLAQKKSGNLNGWISYALSKTEYQIPRINHNSPFPADHDRPNELKIVTNYNFGKWTFSAFYTYSSGLPYTETEVNDNQRPNGGVTRKVLPGVRNSERLPAYQRLDLSLFRKFEMGNLFYEVGLSVFNALDHTNILKREYILDTEPMTVRDIQALGFTPTINLRINFQ